MRLADYGNPEISNTDQGSQFTGFDFTGAASPWTVGRCMDNIFMRVDNYLQADRRLRGRTGSEWIDFYNTERPHSSLSNARKPTAPGSPWI